MALGDNSAWPTSYDRFIQLYDLLVSGYSITEETWQIPDGLTFNLDHFARTGTISIDGFTEVYEPTAVSSGTFKITDYAQPSELSYEIGRAIEFYSSDKGRKITISYNSPGDKILASYLNLVIDAIYNFQRYFGKSSQYSIGGYSTFLKKMAWLEQLVLTHTHSGGDANSTTKKLTTSAFESLAIGNSQFSSVSAERLAQSKIVNGITGIGTGTIPTASSEVTVNSSVVTASSQIFVTATGGADVGQLQYKSKITRTSFTIEFLTSASRTENKTFNYVIYN